jgi:hypothetical protein
VASEGSPTGKKKTNLERNALASSEAMQKWTGKCLETVSSNLILRVKNSDDLCKVLSEKQTEKIERENSQPPRSKPKRHDQSRHSKNQCDIETVAVWAQKNGRGIDSLDARHSKKEP